MTALDLSGLVGSWEIQLKADRKSPSTLKSYLTGVADFLAWCERTGRPAALDRALVNEWTAELFERGLEATTVAARQLAVKRFSAWLADEGEIDEDHLRGLKKPRFDEKVVVPYSEEELRRLLAACSGRDFLSRRDEALVRVFCETGARSFEILGMGVEDVDARAGQFVLFGKGRRERVVPCGPATARALDRYLRVRRVQRAADLPDLWLGRRGRPLAYAGLRYALMGRAEDAGLTGFHLHKLRHSFADRWLSQGGSEGGLQAIAGWKDPAMVRRYSKARQAARAIEESRRLGLGDL
jgi:integrase/recombinase XerD